IAQLGDGQSIELPGQARNCEFQPDHDRATGLKPGRIDGTGDETNRCRSTEEVQEPAPCELRRRQVRSLSFPYQSYVAIGLGRRFRADAWRQANIKGGAGGDRAGIRTERTDLLQGLQEPDSRHRAGNRDGSSDVGDGQIAGLLSGDDLCRFSAWRPPGQWQPGDPAPLDLTLLQVLARRTAAGFPRKPAGEGILRMIRPKAGPSRLDPLSYE